MVSLVGSIISLASDFELPAVTRTLRQTWTLKFSVTETNINWDFLLRPWDKCGLQKFLLLGPINRVAMGQEKVHFWKVRKKSGNFDMGQEILKLSKKSRNFVGRHTMFPQKSMLIQICYSPATWKYSGGWSSCNVPVLLDLLMAPQLLFTYVSNQTFCSVQNSTKKVLN